MRKKKTKPEKFTKLDMPFDEAVKRFINVPAPVKKERKKHTKRKRF